MQCSGLPVGMSGYRNVGIIQCWLQHASMCCHRTHTGTQGSLNQYGIQKETNSDGTTRQLAVQYDIIGPCVRDLMRHAACVRDLDWALPPAVGYFPPASFLLGSPPCSPSFPCHRSSSTLIFLHHYIGTCLSNSAPAFPLVYSCFLGLFHFFLHLHVLYSYNLIALFCLNSHLQW